VLTRGYLKIIALFLIFTFNAAKVKAQICTGSLGDPVINIDFGRGTSNFGPSLGSSTSYRYVGSGYPEDGEYAIAKNTNGMLPNAWFQIPNHTPNDPDGYMMIVNANYEAGVFYEAEVNTDLCQNTTYQFAAWVINLLKYDGRKPRLVFSILTPDNQVLGYKDTGDIPEGTATDWKQYALEFTTPYNVNRVKLKIVNSGPGGNGNDIALDDITFRACGPDIKVGVGSNFSQIQDICEGANTTLNFSSQITGPETFRFQWQKQTNGIWSDIVGATDPLNYNVAFSNARPGSYSYRLTAAEPGNFNSPSCRIASKTITIRVNPPPVVNPISNGPVCVGDAIILEVENEGTYLWRYPDGTQLSTEKSPKILNATTDMSGSYSVTVNYLGCEVTAEVAVDVIPPPQPNVRNPAPQICAGTSVQLSASGGTSYRWFPETGLSDPNIANPIASPTVTTLYTVQVKSGTCYREAQVNVTVNRVPNADAGPDKKILRGYDVKLNGKASGEGIRYFWTPALDIDDANSLSPTVSPKEDTQYTLNVVSDLGCVTALDAVFVKVYPELVVPNAFSPNGDNINDVWNITAIDALDAPVVKVMNRYGTLIFESTGYEKPWDGKYKNEDVPMGVYYYIISMKNGMKPVTGSLTLIR